LGTAATDYRKYLTSAKSLRINLTKATLPCNIDSH